MNTVKFNSLRYKEPFITFLDYFTKIRVNKMLSMLQYHNKVLDVGCWDGYIMQQILDKKKARHVFGVDNSKPAIKICHKKGLLSKFTKSVDKKIPYKNGQFDAVVAGEIIEHLYDVETFLKEIYRILKPNGQLIITTPNLASLGSRLTLLQGKIPWMIENELGNGNSGHMRYFTFNTLEDLLTRHKFKVIEKNSDILHLGRHFYVKENLITKTFCTFGRIIIFSATKK